MKRLVAIFLVMAVISSVQLPLTVFAGGSNAGVMIYEIYTSGGYKSDKNTAPYKYSYIVLYNSSSSEIDLTDWMVQYLKKDASQLTSTCAIALSGTISARGWYLIKGGSNTEAGTISGEEFPVDADLTASNFVPERKARTIILFDETANIAEFSTPISQLSGVVDYVGYGKAAEFEGSGSAPEGSVVKSVKRIAPLDTNDNKLDFFENSTIDLSYINQGPPMSNQYNLAFSHEAGLYSDEFQLTIETDLPGGTIYYTTDGSTPTTESSVYTDAIRIYDRTNEPNTISAITNITGGTTVFNGPRGNVLKGTTVKAVAYDEYGNSSKLYTNSYFVNADPDFFNIPVVSLSIDADEFFGENGLYVKFEKIYDQKRIVDIEYFEPSGERAFAKKAQVKVSGSSTRYFPQKSLNIKFKNNSENFVEYPLFPQLVKESDKTTPMEYFEEFRLHGGGNDQQYAQFRDAFAQYVVKDLRVDTTAYRPVLVFINGEFWGLYGQRERMTETFYSSHYGIDKDDVCIVDIATGYNVTIDVGEDEWISEFNSLTDFIEQNDLTVDDNYEQLITMIDMDNYIDYIIAETFASNIDWPGNNGVIMKNMSANPTEGAATDGRWRFVPYDLDWSYGSLGAYYDDTFAHILGLEPNYPNPNDPDGGDWSINPPESTLFFRKISQNAEFRQKFLDRYLYCLNTVFDEGRLTAIANRFADEMRKYQPMQRDRWDKEYQVWLNSLNTLQQFINNREGYILQFLDKHFALGQPTDLIVYGNAELGATSIRFGDETIDIGSTFSGKYIKNKPFVIHTDVLTDKALLGYQITDGLNSMFVEGTEAAYTPKSDKITIEAIYDTDINFEFDSISAGDGHIVAIENGVPYTWGRNNNGQLGIGNRTDSYSKRELKYRPKVNGAYQDYTSFTNIKSIQAADDHTIVLTNDGIIYSGGGDLNGEINRQSYSTWTELSNIWKQSDMGAVKAVSTSVNHSLYIDENNKLWTGGCNLAGQLGTGTLTEKTDFLRSPLNNLTVKAIAAGLNHSLAVTVDGDLYAFGDNSYGQLGDGTTISTTAPIFVMGGVKDVFTKYNSTFILMENGDLYACGENTMGQLGAGDFENHAEPVFIMGNCAYVSTSKTNTAFIKNDGTLWTTGSNAYGQLLTNDCNISATPLRVKMNIVAAAYGNGFIVYKNAAGGVLTAGNNKYGQQNTTPITNEGDLYTSSSLSAFSSFETQQGEKTTPLESLSFVWKYNIYNGSIETQSDKDYSLFLCIYNKSNRKLELCKLIKGSVPGLSTDAEQITINLTKQYNPDDYEFEVYCWGSNKLIPAESITQ